MSREYIEYRSMLEICMSNKLEKFCVRSENSKVELKYQDLRPEVSENEGTRQVLRNFS